MFFNLIKETNRLRSKINRLLSKGMSNIYLNHGGSKEKEKELLKTTMLRQLVF